jgi:hypothetical protein
MPLGDLDLENDRTTPAELAGTDADLVAAGRLRVSVVALTATGEMAAFAVAVGSADGDHVDHWGTLVDPAHRGHRLGMAVKVAGIRAIQEHLPDKRRITTENAETNQHMVAINETLGFRVHSVRGEFQKQLRPTT